VLFSHVLIVIKRALQALDFFYIALFPLHHLFFFFVTSEHLYVSRVKENGRSIICCPPKKKSSLPYPQVEIFFSLLPFRAVALSHIPRSIGFVLPLVDLTWFERARLEGVVQVSRWLSLL
jgi:hypothetical protein